ncbi:MAG: hypothetical protein ABSA03_08255 [Streptosporangiaceae bacterium]|jgi:hypothetical protein
MRRSAGNVAPWPRIILALSGVASMTLGLVLLPAAPSSLAATQGSPPAAARGSGVTVHGPHMLNPATINPATGAAQLFPQASTVTVSQTDNLVNQQLKVSWTNFTPTTADTEPYQAAITLYPVMVAECRGDNPSSLDKCFGATQSGVPGGTLPAGPINTVYSTTAANGTGTADIQILTSVQNQWLNCNTTHRCSLAIVPDEGGNNLVPPYDCTNHLYDVYSATGSFAYGGAPSGSPACSWDDRIIIPLRFAATPQDCPIRNANLKIIGSPMLGRAMQQWNAKLCAGADPLTVQYSSALPEPEAIAAVQSGLGDVALTTRPAASAVSGNKRYTYAPVAVSAVSIAYWADNDATGDPYTSMKLDPELVAKLLTTSYALSGVSCAPNRSPGCDKGVDGNPADIFVDPEFEKLNPGISNVFLGNATSPADVPIVQSGHSDMTYEVTRWIAANAGASQFLAGAPDRWGMRVNYYFNGVQYPTDAFLAQDPTSQMAHAYSPVFPLSLAVSDMVENWPPGTEDQLQGGTGLPGNYTRLSIELPGQRALFAVLDQGDTAAFLMPTAAIENHAGRYVTPTPASMAAALKSMTTSSNGITQQVSLTSKNPAEYPLTMVVYAMVPTSGVSPAKAADIARWLRYVAGPGQVQGSAPGQLPAGYLPLTAKLRAETLTAANAVQNQTGTTKKPAPSASPKPSASPSAAKSVQASPSPSVSLPAISPKITTVADRNPLTTGITRYVLPAILLIGGVTALGGGSLLVGSTGAIGVRARRLYHAARRRKRKS